MKFILLIFLFIIFTNYLFSKPYQINGYVKDKSSGDLLPNAYIVVNAGNQIISANNYGYFSFKSNDSSTRIKVSFTGYLSYEAILVLISDTTINCLLESDNYIGEVEIKSNSASQITTQEIGSVRFTGKEIEKIPSLLGEHDLVKATQLMPGIKMGKEGTSGMYVRGGTPGQNLILLDDVPVYNVNHLFGYFSVFSPEAIKSVTIYKGAVPARYGGRISSVMDIKMKEGSLNNSEYDVTIGTMSSKLIAEIPIVKGKSSLLVSGRRTYFDLLLAPLWKSTSWDKKTTTTSGYNFYDLNSKLFTDMGSSGKLYWSCYIGRDSYHSQSITKESTISSAIEKNSNQEDVKSTYNWENITTSLRWNKTIGKKMFVNTTLFYSYYSYILDAKSKESYVLIDTINSVLSYNNRSSVCDYGAYADFDYYLSDSHHLVFGSRATFHRFIPSLIEASESNINQLLYSLEIGSVSKALEVNSYAEDRLSISKKLKATVGLHHSLYTSNNIFNSFFQPRVSAILELNQSALKCSGGYMVQPIHNLVNNSNGMAVDIWVPSENGIKPSSSIQFDLGYDRYFGEVYTISIDGYWRSMNNILTYKSGESFFSLYDNWNEKVISGNGKSYGIEIMARKTEGKTTGWIGYTWSKSTQQYSSLNNGNPFPAPYDRRHYFTLSATHCFSQRVKLSGSWVFASGEPLTISSTAYDGDSFYGKASKDIDFLGIFYKNINAPDQIIYYSSINNYRLPYYHRLDIGIDFSKEKKKGTRTWSFSVYNLYGRNNPFMVSIEEDDGKLVMKNSSLFRFLPSVNYRFIFK